MASVADEVRQALAKNGKTRQELAALSGITEGQLSRFARKERGLSVESLETLAKHLGFVVVLRPFARKKRGQ